MSGELPSQLFDDDARRRLLDVADFVSERATVNVASLGAAGLDVEVAITGWGAPPLDAKVLACLPRLKAVVHTAGTVKWMATDTAWERGLRFSSAAAINAKPVAEYVLAAILFSNKRVHALSAEYRKRRAALPLRQLGHDVGNYGRLVGIVGASAVGRAVMRMLEPHDIKVLLYDPFVPDSVAEHHHATKVELDDLFARSDIVSLHQPLLPSTRHMVNARLLDLMKDGATLINSARGGVVDGEALERELVSGRIGAVIDTTEPEILPAHSPLYDLPNVVLTPHIAGSMGNELLRLGTAAVGELERYASGLEFERSVRRDGLEYTA